MSTTTDGSNRQTRRRGGLRGRLGLATIVALGTLAASSPVRALNDNSTSGNHPLTAPVGDDAASQGVTDTSIVLGSSVPQTGPLAIAANISGATAACFEKVNADGGVHGRTIDYRIYDDGYAPDQTAVNVRRLVEQDEAFAVIGTVGTLNGLGVLDYLDGAGVPYVFAVSGSSAWSEPVKPGVFGFQPTYTLEGNLLANYFATTYPDGKVGLLVQNDDSGEEFLTAFEAAAEAAGVDVVSVQYYDRGASTFGPQVLNLQSDGAAVVAMQAIYPAVAGVLTESQAFGYQPDYYVANIGFTEALFDVVGADVLEGVRFLGYFPQAGDDDPARVEHEALMAEYAPDIKVDDFTMLGWSICDTVVDALDRAGPDLTTESFLGALESTSGYTNGLTPPIHLSADDHQPIEAERIFVAKDGVFVAETELLGADGQPIA